MELHGIFKEFEGECIVGRIRYQAVDSTAGDDEAVEFSGVYQGFGYCCSIVRFRFAIKEETDLLALFIHAEEKGIMFEKHQILIAVRYLMTEAFEEGLEDTEWPEGDGGWQFSHGYFLA
jgi:hypothetical protein